MIVRVVDCKSAASRSRLPGLDWAVNPYRGCGHACAYCYSQDVTRFELGKAWGEVIEVKGNIVDVLGKELRRGTKGVYGIGTVTDPYQPLEVKHELTRGCLRSLRDTGATASILTKSDLVLRDLDILREWPAVEIGISMASFDDTVAKLVEPGAPSPHRRIEALARLSEVGLKAYLMMAPIISGLSDSDESLRVVVDKAREARVPTIMWDKFNPKPMATSRLRRALSSAGIKTPSRTDLDVQRIRKTLQVECASAGIELLDAF